MAEVGSAEVVLTARLDKFERDLRRAERELTGFSSRGGAAIGALGTKIAGLAGTTVGIAAVTAGIYKLGSGAISAAAEVESLKIRLTSLLGSQQAAAAEFSRLSRIASTTPFSLRGVVDAGITLRAFGEQNQAAAKAVADLAAFMGVDVVEAAQAYGRAFAAGAGAADILRERGVLAMLQTRAGIDDLTKLSLPEFRKVLFSAMVDPTGPIAGATTRLADSWNGALSNMEDATFNLGAALGQVVTESDTMRGAIALAIGKIDETTTAVSEWRTANQGLIDQKLGDWANGFAAAMRVAADAAKSAIPAVTAALDELSAQAVVLDAYNRGEVGGTDVIGAYLRNAGAGLNAPHTIMGGGTPNANGFRDLAKRLRVQRAEDIADEASLIGDTLGMSIDPFQSTYNMAALQREAAMRAELGIGVAPERVAGTPAAPPPPSPTPTPTGGTKTKTKARTAADHLGDVLSLQRDLADAAASRIEKQIELAERQGAGQVRLNELERERLRLIESTLTTQVELLRAQGTDAGALARAEADLANVQADLAAPAAEVADSFERATVAATQLGTTLSEDILGSVKQFVVGIAQGTARLKDFPRILTQSTAGNVTSRIFDSAFGAGGLFGTGTGAGDFRAFGANLGRAFGADAFGNIVPANFTGPLQPGQVRAGSTAANFATAGGILSTSMAGFSTGQQIAGLFGINSQESQVGGAVGSLAGSGIGLALGGPMGAAVGGFLGGTMGTFVGDLFRDRPNKDQKARGILDEAFKRGMVFSTLALAKEPFGAFESATAPGFAAGMQDEFSALSLLVGLTGASATERGPRNLGRRAGFLGLTEEQARQQNRQVARATGKSVAEGINDITVAFLRYQQEGKGAEITQAGYNSMVSETVKLLQDDLPFGIDASTTALASLEQFGQQQVVNLESLQDALDETAQAAQGFASAIADGIAKAVESGDVMDVSRSLAQSFTSEFLKAATDDLLKNGALADDMATAIALNRDAAAAIAKGDFATAAVLQARLGDTFRSSASTIQQQAAPLVSAVRGFEASLGVASAQGITRQAPLTLVVQNVVDGRVVSESQYNTERLQRGGGVIVPSRVGRS